jgi:hypothetical protein
MEDNNPFSEQTIEVPLKVGSRVSILTDVDTDESGFVASTVFEDTVVTYNQDTNVLEFADNDIGYAEFMDLLDEHDSVQIVRE